MVILITTSLWRTTFGAILPCQPVVSEFVAKKHAHAVQEAVDRHGYFAVRVKRRLNDDALVLGNQHHRFQAAMQLGVPMLLLPSLQFKGAADPTRTDWSKTELLTGRADTEENFKQRMFGLMFGSRYAPAKC